MSHVHDLGGPCKEGTQNIPDNWSPCCQSFLHHTKSCQFDIRFEWMPNNKVWGIVLPVDGFSFLELSYCPFCGRETGIPIGE